MLWLLAKVSLYTAAHCVSEEGVTVNESFFRDKKQEGGWREKGQSRDPLSPSSLLSIPGEGDILPPIH